MTTQVERVIRYYDSHKLRGEEVSQSRVHFAAIQYLLLVLERLFLEQAGVGSSINLYRTRDPMEKPLSPDVMVADGLQIEGVIAADNPSYYIGVDGPAPRIVFEISSDKTWRIDLNQKPQDYAAMSIPEYIAFDPNLETLWTKKWKAKNRLVGWRFDPDTRQYIEIEKDAQGRLWSEQLQSWLVVDGQYLRLYSPDGWQRLTNEEAERQQREIAERQRVTAERETRFARQRVEELAAKLRQLGYDPDNLK